MKIRTYGPSFIDPYICTEIPPTLEAVRQYASTAYTFLTLSEAELLSFAVTPYLDQPDTRRGWQKTFLVTYISRQTDERVVFGFCDQLPNI